VASTPLRDTPALALLRYGRSFGIGAAFAVGWTPCIGPILGAILTLAASSATVAQGAFLLAFWSAGLGLPFIAAGLAMGTAMTAMRRLRPAMPVLEVAGGALVILVGILIFLDEFTIFNTYFTGAADTVTAAEESISGLDVNGPAGFAAAFLAGVVAFLSPCCLPLVPAYLGHLAGVSGEVEDFAAKRGLTLRHALAFVGGFSLVFIVLGASIGAVGYVVRDALPALEKVAGVMLIILGLNLMGVIRIPWLYRTYQVDFPRRSDEPVTPAPGA
jgi:cytochrome c biogenesis protein CcdA